MMIFSKKSNLRKIKMYIPKEYFLGNESENLLHYAYTAINRMGINRDCYYISFKEFYKMMYSGASRKLEEKEKAKKMFYDFYTCKMDVDKDIIEESFNDKVIVNIPYERMSVDSNGFCMIYLGEFIEIINRKYSKSVFKTKSVILKTLCYIRYAREDRRLSYNDNYPSCYYGTLNDIEMSIDESDFNVRNSVDLLENTFHFIKRKELNLRIDNRFFKMTVIVDDKYREISIPSSDIIDRLISEIKKEISDEYYRSPEERKNHRLCYLTKLYYCNDEDVDNSD